MQHRLHNIKIKVIYIYIYTYIYIYITKDMQNSVCCIGHLILSLPSRWLQDIAVLKLDNCSSPVFLSGWDSDRVRPRQIH